MTDHKEQRPPALATGETPRTDALYFPFGTDHTSMHIPNITVSVEHARQLERELAEARADLAKAIGNHAADLSSTAAPNELADALEQRVIRDSYDNDERGVLVRMSELPAICTALRVAPQ